MTLNSRAERLHPHALRAIAASGLGGTTLDMPAETLSDHDFNRLHNLVRDQKMTGLFWTAIVDGAFPATRSQRDKVEEFHLRVLSGVLLLERLLVDTVTKFEAAGVPLRVLKGAALAHLDYADPAQRTFGDIDLLVPGAAFDDAVRLLESDGCARRFPEPRAGFDRRFGKGTCLVTPGGLEIDLHRTFSMGPFGETLAVDQLWETNESFNIGGVEIKALPSEARLLHVTYHSSLGDRRLRLSPLRDIAQILMSSDVDWHQFLGLVEASRGEAVVARALRNAWRELELADVLAASAWADSYREGARATADLSVYGANSTYAATSIATLRVIPSIAEKLRFALALVLPDQTYLTGRYASRLVRLRAGLAQIRHTEDAK